MSREHLVSGSFFEDDSVEMFGFEWCKDKPVRVGLSAATAKILCRKHNSDLSELDKEGQRAFAALRSIQELNAIRKKLKSQRWTIVKHTINGPLLERWCLKTLMNLCCNGPHAIGGDSNVNGWPSDRVVRIAYGLEKFGGNAGLYAVVAPGMNIMQEDKVGFMPLSNTGGQVEAGIFKFRGLTLLLCLEEFQGTFNFNNVVMEGESLTNASIIYHPKQFNFNLVKYPSQRFVLKW